MEVEVKEKLDHDLVLKPMVTWGSPILGPPKEARIINLSTYPYLSVCLSTSFSVCFSTSTFFYIFIFIHVVFSMFIRCLSLSVYQYASLLYLISGFSYIIYSLYAIPSSTFLSYHILSIYPLEFYIAMTAMDQWHIHLVRQYIPLNHADFP